MTTINPALGVPLASRQTEDFDFTTLLVGNNPEMRTANETYAPNTAFPALTPLSRHASGYMIQRQYGDGLPFAGISVHAIDTNTGTTDVGPVFKAINPNIAALTWHASYDTDAKKLALGREGTVEPDVLVVTGKLQDVIS